MIINILQEYIDISYGKFLILTLKFKRFDKLYLFIYLFLLKMMYLLSCPSFFLRFPNIKNQ